MLWLILTLLAPSPVLSLDLAHRVEHYGHAAWKVGDGSFRGYPRSLAQTADGYLWLGTEFGIFRFDGVRFTPWLPPQGRMLPSDSILKLLGSRDGSLWIGTLRGLARLRNGDLTEYEAVRGHFVAALAEDRRGAIWVGTSGGLNAPGLICAIRGTQVRCSGQEGRYGRFVSTIHEASDGAIWVGTATGLWRVTSETVEQQWMSPPLTEIHAIADYDGALVVSLSRSVVTIVDRDVKPLKTLSGPLKPTAMLALGAELWLGTQDAGLVHMDSYRVDRFGVAEGLSGSFVSDVLKDREGNIWVATLGGLDRFRRLAVVTFASNDGFGTDSLWSVSATRDAGVWGATPNGLDRVHDGQVSMLLRGRAVQSLLEDTAGTLWVGTSDGLVHISDGNVSIVPSVVGPTVIQAIAQDSSGAVWVADQNRGLRRVSPEPAGLWIDRAAFDGRTIRAMVPRSSGGLWLGYFEGGVDVFDGQRVQDGLRSAGALPMGAVNQLTIASDGSLLVAAEGGVARWSGSRLETIPVARDSRCRGAHWAIDAGDGALWIHTPCGLARVAGNTTTWLDATDGVHESETLGSFSPKVTRSSDGRIWFATLAGLSVFDPHRVARNVTPPAVHIETVVADDVVQAGSSSVRLRAPVRNLRIEFTATSLTMPSRVRFRYKLEGRDSEWTEATATRQVTYTDLSPNAYRFRVIAANNDGVWNEVGAAATVTILPAVYQTLWFRALATLTASALLWGLYHLRMRSLSARMLERFEERLNERTRLAQNLHDTLLQGIISSSMQLHVVAQQLQAHPERPRIERIMDGLRSIAKEGREAIGDLRLTHTNENLEALLMRDGEVLRGEQLIELRISVEGRPRMLHPVVHDEVYRIGREAILNALRHARAQRLEIVVSYAAKQLALHVRDDGCGVQEDVLAMGREGHWGLRGMRERADGIGAALRIMSRPGSGTEVIVIVSALRAFATRFPSTPASP